MLCPHWSYRLKSTWIEDQAARRQFIRYLFYVFSTLKESVAGGGERLPIVWIFLLLLNLSDRRGPAALGRGEVPPSAGEGVPKDACFSRL